MNHRIPPLNPLRVFDVAAHSSSFTEAAAELMVTQAAVSRQIGTLEGYFGCKLFDRDQRVLTLTPEGRRLHREIGPAFEMIGQATNEILRRKDPNNLTIQSYPTIIGHRLLPNLHQLTSANRSIEINFINAVRPNEFSFDLADIIIRYGPDTLQEPDERDFKMSQDTIVPAASPAVIERYGDRETTLQEASLIMTKYRHSDWIDWVDGKAISIEKRRRHQFDSSLLGYLAALNGVGICMAQGFVSTEDFASERLIPLSDETLSRDAYYWCQISPRKRLNRPLKMTLDWLQSLSTPDVM